MPLAPPLSPSRASILMTMRAFRLHRYLRWRQPGYDPEAHLGGALYLFLRGMAGPGTPLVGGETCGVFSWRPPVALVMEVSDLLAGAVGC